MIHEKSIQSVQHIYNVWSYGCMGILLVAVANIVASVHVYIHGNVNLLLITCTMLCCVAFESWSALVIDGN